MTKFEPCAKGDRRGVERGDDVLLDDAYDIPAEGIVVDGFTGAFELDGSGEARDDADRVRRALSKAATSNVTSHRAFIDIVHSEQSSSEAPVMCSIVLEFALHEADSKTNAARALDWFEVACEATRRGSSYAGSAVKVEANGKILKISSPIAFLEESSKPKRQTLIGEARSRDAWLESGSVFVLLGQTTKTSTLSQKVTIPANATFLGVVSERSFLSLVSTIGASMDVFTSDSNGARVGACGALVDSSGGASENALLDINRLRVIEARKARIEKDEKEDVTRKRLAEQSRNTSDAVKESVRYAASKKQKCTAGSTGAGGASFLGKFSSLGPMEEEEDDGTSSSES